MNSQQGFLWGITSLGEIIWAFNGQIVEVFPTLEVEAMKGISSRVSEETASCTHYLLLNVLSEIEKVSISSSLLLIALRTLVENHNYLLVTR